MPKPCPLMNVCQRSICGPLVPTVHACMPALSLLVRARPGGQPQRETVRPASSSSRGTVVIRVTAAKLLNAPAKNERLKRQGANRRQGEKTPKRILVVWAFCWRLLALAGVPLRSYGARQGGVCGVCHSQ